MKKGLIALTTCLLMLGSSAAFAGDSKVPPPVTQGGSKLPPPSADGDSKLPPPVAESFLAALLNW